jgi:hypothetical protein
MFRGLCVTTRRRLSTAGREDLDHALRTDVLRKEGFEVREPRE